MADNSPTTICLLICKLRFKIQHVQCIKIISFEIQWRGLNGFLIVNITPRYIIEDLKSTIGWFYLCNRL